MIDNKEQKIKRREGSEKKNNQSQKV